MNYWIFVVKEQKEDGKILSAREIFVQRMKDHFWGIGEKTPNRKNLTEGDKAVYYIGSPEMVFAGTATLASSCFELNDSQKKEYGHGKRSFMPDYGVRLEEIDVWQNPKSVKDLVPHLEFIENKEFWGTYFQGGVRPIPGEDFKIIIGERETSLVEQIVSSKDVESQAEFALESHLEEFIHQNWEIINWGSKIELYKTDEQDGRQFPAGTWNIDFLALDKGNNDLVVIELKRGKTSDSVVGQIQRYISWVKENVAEKGQNVRGIIVAKKVDEALTYAVKDLKHVEVKTYEVSFKLNSFSK